MDKRDHAKRPAGDAFSIDAPPRPRKQPRQARSIALVDALKQAGREILEREGRAALSLYRLSEYAGVSVSSIYQYFPTIESVIASIFDDYRNEVRSKLLNDVVSMPESATLFDGLVLIARTGMAALRKWSLMDAEFFARAASYDELVRLDLVKSEQIWASVVTPALMTRFPNEIRAPRLDMAQFLVSEALLASLRAIALKKPAYLGEADMAILLARMAHAVLTAGD
jgi:AcrR family transcriptional regulator